MTTFRERAANSVEHMFSLYFDCSICNFVVISRFGFEGGF